MCGWHEWGLLTKLSQPLLGVCFAHLSQSLVDCVAILAQAGRQRTAIINERLAIGINHRCGEDDSCKRCERNHLHGELRPLLSCLLPLEMLGSDASDHVVEAFVFLCGKPDVCESVDLVELAHVFEMEPLFEHGQLPLFDDTLPKRGRLLMNDLTGVDH